jgi:hypothetical protein
MWDMTRALGCLLLLAACDPEAPEGPEYLPPDAEGKADGDSGIIVTRNANVDLFRGYNRLLDQTANWCVESATGAGKLAIGGVSEAFDLVYVSSRDQIASELGIDLGLSIRYAGNQGGLDLSFVNEFSGKVGVVSLLLKIERHYLVLNRDRLQLVEQARSLLDAGPSGLATFAQACGTRYASGVRHGAYYYMLITYRTQDEDSARELKAKLAVASVVGVDADLAGRLKDAATMSDVEVNIRVVSDGFSLSPDVTPDFLLDPTQSADGTFSTLTRIREDMRSSIDADVERELQQNPAVHRTAVVTGVQPGLYSTLLFQEPAGFNMIEDRMLEIDQYIRRLSSVQQKIHALLRDEIQPFLATSDANRARHNFVPPARPASLVAELVDVTSAWRKVFDATEVGSVAESVDSDIRRCWTQASNDPFGASCDEEHALARAAEVDALIASYAFDARVAPLQLVADPVLRRQTHARQFCEAEIDKRLPTVDEAPLLAPFVAQGAVEWRSHHRPRTVWLDGSGCTGNQRPAFVHEPGQGDPAVLCLDERESLTTLCVSKTGPVPSLPAP